jgi:hypothetical protein
VLQVAAVALVPLFILSKEGILLIVKSGSRMNKVGSPIRRVRFLTRLFAFNSDKFVIFMRYATLTHPTVLHTQLFHTEDFSMSRIQIADLNSSDISFLSELTDEEMSGIDGGCRGCYLAAAALFVLMFFL